MSIFAMTIVIEACRMCVYAQCSRDLGPTRRLMFFADNLEAVAETAHGAFNLLSETVFHLQSSHVHKLRKMLDMEHLCQEQKDPP